MDRQDGVRLEIQTFGGLSIRLDGERVTNLASRKAEALLVFLAANPRTHPREVLVDRFWDEKPRRRALANLRVALSSLRKQLGAYLAITRETVGFSPGALVRLDFAELEDKLSVFVEEERQMSSAAVDQLEPVFALYQGEFLEGFFIRKARRFEEWVVQERERLHWLVLAALRELVAFDIKSGAHKRGIVHARRLLQLNPLMESGHRQLIRLLAVTGQRMAALAQFERCRKILANELQIVPNERTRALYEQIKAGETLLTEDVGQALDRPGQPALLKKEVQDKIRAFMATAKAAEIEDNNRWRPASRIRRTQIALTPAEPDQRTAVSANRFVQLAQ